MNPYGNPHRIFWRSMVKKVASDTLWTPASHVHMPDAEHTWGFSRLLCHCSDIFRQNSTRVKWVKISRCDKIWLREKYTALFSFTQWKNSLVSWQIQSPDSPAWHPDMALLCLLWYSISRGNSPVFLGSPLEATAELS